LVEHDTRRIMKIGLKSLAVTIPKKWAMQLGIDVGSLVDMFFDGNTISIEPRGKQELEPLQLSVVAEGRKFKSAIRKLIACYTEGITKVKVKCSYEEFTELTSILSKAVPITAFGRPESKYHEIVFLDIAAKPEDVIKKITNIIKGLIESIYEATEEECGVGLVSQEVEKLFNLGLRLCKKHAVLSRGIETLDMLDMLLFLKLIRELFDVLSSNLGMFKCYKENNAVFKTLEYVNSALSSFTLSDIDRALKLLEIKPVSEEDEVPKELAQAIDKLIDIGSSIAEISISKCIRDKACACRYFYPEL